MMTECYTCTVLPTRIFGAGNVIRFLRIRRMILRTSTDRSMFLSARKTFGQTNNTGRRKYINTKYYLFGSFFKQGTGRKSQILVSDGPLGPFLPFCSPFTPDGWDCLDATLYVENGVPYSVFCHEWVQIVDGTMEAVRLKADLSGPDGNPITLFKASDAPWVRPTSYCGKFDGYITDGPFLRKSKNGKLFMIWSSTTENSQYAVGMAVSESGSVLGPWRHMETPLFGKNGGHASIFEFKGKLLLSLHMPNILSLERAEFFELEEMDDGLKLKGLFESEDKNEK